MEKINVLHLSSEKTWRGGEQQIANLIDELEKLEIGNLVAVRKDSAFEQHCINRKIPYFPLGFSNSLDVFSASAIKKICVQQKVDIIHLHSSKSHGIGVLAAVLGNKVPMILSRRVDFVPNNNRITRWKYNHQSIKRIVGVSNEITSIMRHYVSSPEKCITVHSGIDLNKDFIRPEENILRKEFNILPGTHLIGNTSALEDHKDYFTFIDTIGILAKRNIRASGLIIGKGSLENPLKEYVREKGLQDKIIFTGFRYNINELLPCLDIFFMPSKQEGLGTSILDAFLAGVPVVATAAGGIPEMVVHKQTGMLSPVGASESLAANITEVLQDQELKTRIQAGAKEKVKEFSKSITASKTLQIYKEVLTEST